MHLSRCARFIARFVSVIYLAFVVYTLFRFPSMDGMMVVISGLGVFWMAFYTEEQLKERRLSVWLSAAFVILLTLILIYSDLLYSVLNMYLLKKAGCYDAGSHDAPRLSSDARSVIRSASGGIAPVPRIRSWM